MDCGTANQVLLVEGQDDLHVILQLWCRLVRQGDSQAVCVPNFCIDEKGGIDRLLPAIYGEVNVDSRRAVGIVVDADDRPQERWESLVEPLREAGIRNIPERPQPGGICIGSTPQLPSVGIWLMPDNQSTGELEDFVRTMLPDNDPVWPSSQLYIDGIDEKHRKFKGGKVLRAKVHAWLATREQPGRMGAAIKERDLDIEGELAVSFANWLQRVFGGL